MKHIILPFLGLLGLSFLGCNIINPEESVPAYLYIEPFTLETTNFNQGSASEKITEVWVTVDDEFLGAYPLPATVPVLRTGEVNVFLEAGIKDNGISATPEIYPFYQPYEVTIRLTPGETVSISPTITYDPNTRFALIESFDSGSTFFQDTLVGNVRMELSHPDAFEGNFSGKIRLTAANPIAEIGTIFSYDDLTSRSPLVYLEVNYRSDVPVVFGFVGQDGSGGSQNAVYDPGFNPKDTWNKIYFNMSGLLATSPYDSHQLALRAFIPTENGQLTLENATVCLDNIKLVHF